MFKINKSDSSDNSNKKIQSLVILEYIVLVSLILYFGRTLFIPLSFSILISFILYPICKWLEKKGISRSFAIFISIFCLSVILAAIFYLLFLQVARFTSEWELLKVKLLETTTQLGNFFLERFNISLESQSEIIKKGINNFEVFLLLKNVAYSFSEIIFNLIIFPVFAALLLYHRHLLASVLYQVFSSYKKETIHEILIGTIHEYYNFIKGMLLVYLIVGILNSIGLAIVGVPHPFLFGFIASILTFIPYVGIIISSLLPIVVSWVTYNSIWYPLGVVLVFTIVQLLEANIIFPFAVGNRLKINTLVIIVVIIIGGIIWGAAGMILFIPFVSIIKLIADRTESLKTLSLLLGNGTQTKNNKVDK